MIGAFDHYAFSLSISCIDLSVSSLPTALYGTVTSNFSRYFDILAETSNITR